MSGIVIGKHTLESLTSGMYTEPYVVFREYIQNSVDSIDEAVHAGVLSPGAERIVVRLVPTENQIIISDNGLGIRAADVEKSLISIGNSKKSSETSRGFRGIGRLSALSYCKRLTFTTSFPGEPTATTITIDAAKLSERLADDSQPDVTAIDVLESVYVVSNVLAKKESHYFTVQLDCVDSNSRLLSYADVEAYLMQNAPVPYHPAFVWGKEIVKRLQSEGLAICSYHVFLEHGTRSVPIYKPYKDTFLVDKGKNITDTVQDIQIIKFLDHHKKLSAVGWLAKTNYKGSIYEKEMKGIRLRKGNILVGDQQTLNGVFKDSRFNGWSIGEIFAIDPLLVPNARRDNFEKTPAYFSLMEQLTTLAGEITRDIRAASLKRNVPLSDAVRQLNETSQQAASAIDQGVTEAQKVRITKKLKEARAAVSNSMRNETSEQYDQELAFAELDMLTGRLKGATNYKALNIIGTLTNTEKKILERVIRIIETLEIENADVIIEAIINKFSEEGGNSP
ncbi:MAG: ATP-binding protein [Lachnospiraceae bacterium]|nr:ATP-binding protein [Lachnospiraceae bacterium]